jgi:hypothetical protein
MAGVTSTVVKESAEELILNPLSIGNISGETKGNLNARAA